MRDDLRQLPKVQTLLESASAEDLIAVYGRNSVAGAVREKIDLARATILADAPMPDAIRSETLFWKDISASLNQSRQGSLNRVINSTGVIIHTNLGRAPLAPEAIAATQAVAASYSTLEFDIGTGKRGSRHQHAQQLICELTGAEAAIVVNNCAGAILTVLSALANQKQVIASRGELVEIGGSFRMPDVIAQSGAQLREIGTTNKTHLADYETAISDETALLLKSHTSNYAVVGFASSPDRKDLAKLASANALPLVEDLGSGVLVDLAPYGLPDEPRVKDVLDAGVDVVTFSGDKLLGGPQAGIIAGRKDLIDRVKAHPMARAVRIDKLSLAALIATLDLYREPNNPIERVPVLRKLAEPIDLVYARAKQLADGLAAQSGWQTVILSSKARAGGGSLPQQDLSSFAVALEAPPFSPDELAERLRSGPVPIIGRITKDQFLLDARTISDTETAEIIQAAGSAVSG
ncbi:MAG: L-seryl-tRNA(Sec) selenium transferase [Henriciella sp.]